MNNATLIFLDHFSGVDIRQGTMLVNFKVFLLKIKWLMMI